MAVNLMGGSKFKMPQRASNEELNRIVEKGQKNANWNVSVHAPCVVCFPDARLATRPFFFALILIRKFGCEKI